MKLKANNWPTEPGYCWVKKHPRAGSGIVFVERFVTCLCLWTFGEYDNSLSLERFKRDYPDALFSDRIPEPEVEAMTIKKQKPSAMTVIIEDIGAAANIGGAIQYRRVTLALTEAQSDALERGDWEAYNRVILEDEVEP